MADDVAQGTVNGQVRKDGPVFGSLSGVVPEDINWLVEPFLPAGELVTNNADGGTGKGLFSVFIAAQLTLIGKNVIFAVAEEAVNTTAPEGLPTTDIWE